MGGYNPLGYQQSQQEPPQQQQAPLALPPHLQQIAAAQPAHQQPASLPPPPPHAAQSFLPPHLQQAALPPYLQQVRPQLPPHLQLALQAAPQQLYQQHPAYLQQQQQQQPPAQQAPLPALPGAMGMLAARAQSQQQAQQQQQALSPAASGPPGRGAPPGFAQADAGGVGPGQAAVAGSAAPKVPPGWSLPGQQQQQQQAATAVPPYRPPHLIQRQQQQLQQSQQQPQWQQQQEPPPPQQQQQQEPPPQQQQQQQEPPPPQQQQQQEPQWQQQQQQQQQEEPQWQQQHPSVAAQAAGPSSAGSGAAAAAAAAMAPQSQPEQQPAPAAAPPPLPRPTAAQLKQMLAGEGASGSSPCFSPDEALAWAGSFAPVAAALVDDNITSYIQYISSKHGRSVLACILFLVFQHETFKGANKNLSLHTADHPVKVLNKRMSYYVDLFTATRNAKPKAEALALLIARRPDAVSQLNDPLLIRLFDSDLQLGPVCDVLAGLALLPDDWQAAMVKEQPQTWLSNFVSAVLADPSNAGKMVALLEKRLAAAAAAAGGAAAAAAPAGSSVDSPHASVSFRDMTAAADSSQQQQQQAVGTPPAAAGGAWSHRASAAGISGGGGGGGGTWAGVVAKPSSSSEAAEAATAATEMEAFGRPARQPAAAGSRSGGAGGDGGRRSSPLAKNGTNSSSSSTDDGILQLALTQLIHERPDVAQHASKQLRERVRLLPLGAALTAIGSLMELPEGWKAGVRDPQAELQRVVARAAAAAAAEGAGATGGSDDGGGGWVEQGAGGSSSGSSGLANGRKQGPGASLTAAWSAVERRRPDVVQHLGPGHRAIISKLPATQQMQMLAMLEELPVGMVARARDPESALLGLIDKFANVVSRPMNEQLRAALEDLQQCVPREVAERLDGGVYARIAAMPLDRALVAVRVLKEANYQSGWHERVNNAQAWLMGVITRGLARHFGEAA